MDPEDRTRERGFWQVEVGLAPGAHDPRGIEYRRQIADVLEGPGPRAARVSDLYFFAGDLTRETVERIGAELLANGVTHEVRITPPRAAPPSGGADTGGADTGGDDPPQADGASIATVLKKPGVMDPCEASLLKGLSDLGVENVRVRTGVRVRLKGELDPGARRLIAEKVLSNPAIEDVHWGDRPLPSPFLEGRPYTFAYGEVPLAGLSDDQLLLLSAERQLSLDLAEMRAVRDHFASIDRAPSDAELETIAQTWSEHCCHKTFTGRIEHSGPTSPQGTLIDNLLRSTIRRATDEIAAPWCLSVFVDNAGAIAFDDEYAVTMKVETHNHPSAIEPYGGAGTGIGGVLRDTLGTGLGARPIANTDVFCFGRPDLAQRDVPPGALHPLRVLRGVVAGVRDYGNRMGIPTASGAVCFDDRYTGNPLVFCGSVGIIPRDRITKEVRPRDRIYVLGGRTGRDGIHGATFSSVALTEDSETVSSGAVQIGNAITEKKVLDILLAARDRGLFRAVTDCGAGGLSSAVGEMGEKTGARVELDRVPLKYEGLSYWEIWISEAQERMVLAVPPEHAAALEELAVSEGVECTAIGEFTDTGRLELRYEGNRVADLAMAFLHDGRPRETRRSEFSAPELPPPQWKTPRALGKVLREILAAPNVASKEWIIRQYDHEVQGASVLKPLQGALLDGPGDGVAFAPRFDSTRGVVIGCGINPLYGDLEPYRMAVSAVDEAVRNVVAAGGDPRHTAILDNFCWGDTDRPEQLGAMVEAARGASDTAVALGTPFISGKDSLHNDYRVGDRIVSIPPTLLISSISVVPDVRRLCSMDLKAVGNRLVLVGRTREELGGSHFFRAMGIAGGKVPGLVPEEAVAIHAAVHALLARGLATSCHDLSEGGLAVALAEMAFAGGIGAELRLERVVADSDARRDDVLLFSESNARYLLEVPRERLAEALAQLSGVPAAEVGETISYRILRILGVDGTPVVAEALDELKDAWKGTLDLDGGEAA